MTPVVTPMTSIKRNVGYDLDDVLDDESKINIKKLRLDDDDDDDLYTETPKAGPSRAVVRSKQV